MPRSFVAEYALLTSQLSDIPRLIGRTGQPGGPSLICLGGIHGNEPAGVLALRRFFQRVASRDGFLGHAIGLVGNRGALARGRRFVDQDLNRIWTPERMAQRSRVAEENELREIIRAIRSVLEARSGRVFFLDLHTTSGPGPAFAILEDTLANREFGFAFPVPIVLGAEEEIEGTLAGYLCDLGVTTLGFEAGQHDDPSSVDRAEAAIWIALEASGILEPGAWREVVEARQSLARGSRSLPRIVEMRYRKPVRPEDQFQMASGFANFRAVAAGEVLAHDRQGPITAKAPGFVLLPLYQDQGEDGFFLVRPVRAFWLRLSAKLRRLGLARYLHWLPGVRRHPELAGSFVVDRETARWPAMELFHLLGFRRRGGRGRYVVMSRRAHDLSGWTAFD
jgi:succinylglutamate desuccinylase